MSYQTNETQFNTFENRPLSYTIFKGIKGKFGAIRFTLKKAYSEESKSETDKLAKKAGCVFVDGAPPIAGSNSYDWEVGKATLALNLTDIGKIIVYLQNPFGKLDIYHDRGAGTNNRGINISTLSFIKPEDKDNIFVTITNKKSDKEKKATIPISRDEAEVLLLLLEASVPQILAWV